MKKFFLMLAVALTPALFLASCSDDDDDVTYADDVRGTYAVMVDIEAEGIEIEDPEFNLVVTPVSCNTVKMIASGTYENEEGEDETIEATILNVKLKETSENTLSIDQNVTVDLTIGEKTQQYKNIPLKGTFTDNSKINLELSLKLYGIFDIDMTVDGTKRQK